jgi:hypothetical protein
VATFDELKKVKRRHAAALLKHSGVCGVDIEQDAPGGPIITVHLDTKDPAVKEQLPRELEGFPLKFVETGPIRKQAKKRG